MVNYNLIIGAAFWIIILIIIIFFITRYILRRRKRKRLALEKIREENPNVIPQEVIDDFNEAEKILKESNGTISPQQILWDIARKKKEVHNGYTYNKETAREAGRRTEAGEPIQDSGTRRTTSDSQPADGSLSRDRESVKGRDIPIQSDRDTSKNQRDTKRHWAEFK